MIIPVTFIVQWNPKYVGQHVNLHKNREKIMKLTLKQQTIFEIILVLSIMLLIKDIADRFSIIGAGSIAMWGGILVATLFMKKENVTWKDRGLSLPVGRKNWLKAMGLTLFIIVTSIAFMALVLPLISNFIGISIPESSTERFEFFLGNPLLFSLFLIMVIWIGAALGEELLMRGFLLNSLIKLFGESKKGLTLAVIFHSFIFGMLHISQGIPGVIGTGVVAVILGYVYLYNSRNLFPLIIAHGLINSIGIFAYYLSNGAIT